jgi:uncharacterized protein YheU (UPF0270 family)
MKTTENPKENPQVLIIPLEKISEEALEGLINEFILREGTDYGQVEVSLEKKHEQIIKQLKSGRTLVVFDPVEESASLVRKEMIKKTS